MKTPITPLRMPLDLKERAKKQAKKEGYVDKFGNVRLSPWIFHELEKTLDIKELVDKYIR